jgi:hypothetical protein
MLSLNEDGRAGADTHQTAIEDVPPLAAARYETDGMQYMHGKDENALAVYVPQT